MTDDKKAPERPQISDYPELEKNIVTPGPRHRPLPERKKSDIMETPAPWTVRLDAEFGVGGHDNGWVR